MSRTGVSWSGTFALSGVALFDFIKIIEGNLSITQDHLVKAWVFSSYARGEAHSGSDIDILVVFDKEAKVSLMRHAKISLELSEILGFDVDLITEGTLLSFAERTANNDKILIYERAS